MDRAVGGGFGKSFISACLPVNISVQAFYNVAISCRRRGLVNPAPVPVPFSEVIAPYAGPSVTILNKGFTKPFSNHLRGGVYLVFFNQQG